MIVNAIMMQFSCRGNNFEIINFASGFVPGETEREKEESHFRSRIRAETTKNKVSARATPDSLLTETIMILAMKIGIIFRKWISRAFNHERRIY